MKFPDFKGYHDTAKKDLFRPLMKFKSEGQVVSLESVSGLSEFLKDGKIHLPESELKKLRILKKGEELNIGVIDRIDYPSCYIGRVDINNDDFDVPTQIDASLANFGIKCYLSGTVRKKSERTGEFSVKIIGYRIFDPFTFEPTSKGVSMWRKTLYKLYNFKRDFSKSQPLGYWLGKKEDIKIPHESWLLNSDFKKFQSYKKAYNLEVEKANLPVLICEDFYISALKKEKVEESISVSVEWK